MLSKKQRLPIQSLPKKNAVIRRSGDLVLKSFFSTLAYPRFGVIISKKVAKKAVRRNQLKRWAFNLFKILSAKIEPADYLLIFNKDLEKEQLEAEIKRIFSDF